MIAFIKVNNKKIISQEEASTWERKLYDFYANHTPYVEAHNSMEFFLNLGQGAKAVDTLYRLWSSLIPGYGDQALIGLASSKLLARALVLLQEQYPSNKLLPGLDMTVNTRGVCISLPPEQEEKLRPQLPLTVLWPLEEKIRRRLFRLGLTTWGEVATLAPERLRAQIGQDAYYVRELAWGKMANSFKSPPKGIQFPIIVEEGMGDLTPILTKAATQLAKELEQQWLSCRELILKGITQEGCSFFQQRVFLRPCSNDHALVGETKRLWQKLRLNQLPKELSLLAVGLEPQKMEQMGLFAVPDKQMKEEALTQLLQRLRQDFPSSLLDLAKHYKRDRREAMLAFYDPWRF